MKLPRSWMIRFFSIGRFRPRGFLTTFRSSCRFDFLLYPDDVIIFIGLVRIIHIWFLDLRRWQVIDLCIMGSLCWLVNWCPSFSKCQTAPLIRLTIIQNGALNMHILLNQKQNVNYQSAYGRRITSILPTSPAKIFPFSSVFSLLDGMAKASSS